MKPHSTDKSTGKPIVPTITDRLSLIASYILAAVLVLVPFHAFLTITLASAVGHYDALRLWKELVLLLLSPLVIFLVVKTPGLGRSLKRSWLFWAILAYAVLHIVLGIVALAKGQVNMYAFEYALTVNLRPLLIFCLTYGVVAAGSTESDQWLRRRWMPLILYPAAIVIGFGLMQMFVLPTNFLYHFGYNASTIMPYETVDQKLDYIRMQSTLRGANPLGAYLVLGLTAVVVLLLKSKKDQRQILGITLLSAGLVVLVATYSRSAYVGMLLAAIAAIILVVHGRAAKKRLAIVLVSLAVIAAGALFMLRDNNRFENTFFHTDDTSQSAVSSNGQRSLALRGGLSDVLHEPFGRGPGTAGPASAHNNASARIAENYYLQIGQETGWLGLALFVAINLAIGRRLFIRRDDTLARVLLASLIGIGFINLVSHAWTDDTLSLLWWGLAGIALAPYVRMTRINNLETSPDILNKSSKSTSNINTTNRTLKPAKKV